MGKGYRVDLLDKDDLCPWQDRVGWHKISSCYSEWCTIRLMNCCSGIFHGTFPDLGLTTGSRLGLRFCISEEAPGPHSEQQTFKGKCIYHSPAKSSHCFFLLFKKSCSHPLNICQHPTQEVLSYPEQISKEMFITHHQQCP